MVLSTVKSGPQARGYSFRAATRANLVTIFPAGAGTYLGFGIVAEVQEVRPHRLEDLPLTGQGRFPLSRLAPATEGLHPLLSLANSTISVIPPQNHLLPTLR